jgi:cytochrome c oxidase subunit 3
VSHAASPEHPEFLAHHWETPRQQFEAGKLGMWLFLSTELLLFGGLFCAYAIWRAHHPEMFKFGSQFLNTWMGAINTAVLITSSLTMATAVTMAQLNRRRELVICLALTLAGAATFLVIKYFEYSHKFHEGFLPGIRFYERHEQAHAWDLDSPIPVPQLTAIDPASGALSAEELGLPEGIPVETSTVAPPAAAPGGVNVAALTDEEESWRRGGREEEPGDEAGGDAGHDEAGHVENAAGHGPVHPVQDPDRPANAHKFFDIYFMMTGLHGLHVLVGGIVLTWLMVGAIRGRFNEHYFTPVDLGGLYWHVVDLIWIFLFPLFYLI